MQSNIVQISNVFNLMVQADSRLEFYHFGWRSDINRNIDNNFDQGTITGRKFPAVQFHVPENTSHSQDGLSYLGNKEEIQITLYFDDLQDYNNDSSGKTDTLIEEWTKLKQIAEDFVLNFNVLLCDKYGIGYIDSEVKYIPRSNLHNDKLITWEVSFMLVHTTPCTLEENKIDLAALPNNIREFDLENYLKGSENTNSFTLDGINEYIKAPSTNEFNFEWSDTFSFEFWVYIDSPLTTFFYSNWWDQTGVYFRVTGTGAFNLQFRGGALISGRCLDVYTDTGNFAFGQWNQIILTNNGGGVQSSVKVYCNTVNVPFTIVGCNQIAAPFSIKQTNRPFELGASTGIGGYAEAFFNLCRCWNIVLSASDVNSLNDSGCPTFAVQEDDLIWEMKPENSIWNGSSFDVVDSTETQPDFDSVLMEEADKIEITPC